jgi:hypothetical protein
MMISDASQSPVADQARAFLRGLCSHVVCLTGTAVPLDNRGAPCGQQIFFNFSGFVVSLYDRWLWVTAGHVFKELDGQIRRGEARIVHCHLADYYGLDLDSGVPIPFGYSDVRKFWIDDDARGLDVGIIVLTPLYRRLLEKNKVRAIEQDGWEEQGSLKFDDYALLGFPEELFERQRRVSVTGDTIIGGVRPVLMFANASDAVPLNKPVPEHPWLAVELRDKGEIKSIKGMSGGPILGFQRRTDKPPLYTAVAIQSWWDAKRRIAFGTRLPVVMEMIDREIRVLCAERLERDQQPSQP